MAFVTRAARSLKASDDTATPAGLGPGSYKRPDSFAAAERGYAPFSSTAARTMLASTASYNPSPGDYDAKPLWGSHAGESAFKSRVERLKGAENASDAPGPGAYAVESSWTTKTAHVSPERQERRTVLINRQSAAPSVPARHQSYGYEETETGQLVAQKPTHLLSKDLPGPADYNPEPVKVKSAVDFSRVPARTENFGGARDVPGPGAYEVESSGKGFAGSNLRKHSSAPFGSRVPLDCNRPVYEDELDGPGRAFSRAAINGISRVSCQHCSSPGSYDVHARSGQRRAPAAQHGFSISQRGADASGRGEMPGPGAYDPYAGAAAAPKRYVGLDRRAAFSSNTNRFRRLEDQPTASVGPGAYVDNKGFADDVLKRKPRGGAFGSAGPRFGTTVPKVATQIPGADDAAASAPGPGAYDVEPKPGATLTRQYRKQSAAFASTTARLEGNPNVALEPGPGLYETRPEWDKDKQRGYKTGKSVFVTRARRRGRAAELCTGPGQYESEQQRLWATVPRGALLSTTGPRFEQGPRLYVPGPGQYTVNRELAKPSFNVTFD